MTTPPNIPVPTKAQRAYAERRRAAAESIEDRAATDYETMVEALSKDGGADELEWWAAKLAQALLAGDSQLRDVALMDLRKHVGRYAREKVAAWTTADWYDWDDAQEDKS